jgi:hypothetical protein
MGYVANCLAGVFSFCLCRWVRCRESVVVRVSGFCRIWLRAPRWFVEQHLAMGCHHAQIVFTIDCKCTVVYNV